MKGRGVGGGFGGWGAVLWKRSALGDKDTLTGPPDYPDKGGPVEKKTIIVGGKHLEKGRKRGEEKKGVLSHMELVEGDPEKVASFRRWAPNRVTTGVQEKSKRVARLKGKAQKGKSRV